MTSLTKLSWRTVRSYTKIEARWGKSAIEIQKALEEVGSEFVLPYSSITRWVRQFNNGLNTLSNKHLCGRLLSATTGENVENVAKLLNDDRRYSCDEIAHELDISHGPVHRILTECLQMRKIEPRWVLHMLSERKKHQCVNIARKLLKRWRWNVTTNCCNRSFEPELKRQGSEWHTKKSPKPVKFRPSQNYAKMLMISLHRKCQEMIDRTSLILHDNASPIKPTLSRSCWSHTSGKFLIIPLTPLTLICSQNLTGNTLREIGWTWVCREQRGTTDQLW